MGPHVIGTGIQGDTNTMKKLLMSLLLMVGFASFAGVVEPFKQFTQNDYTFNPRTEEGQNNYYQSMMTLSVSSGSGVWLSNFVDHWDLSAYEYNPVVDLHGFAYDMKGNQKYGYIDQADLAKLAEKKGVDLHDLQKEDYQGIIKWASNNNDPIMIQYNDDAGHTNETQGYFLDYFEKDTNIYLVLTTLEADGGEVVAAYQYVQGGDPNAYDTTLVSRQITANPQLDLAGNVRINYGLDTTQPTTGREFVSVYDNGTYSKDLERARYSSTGGPLPGVFFAGLLSLGTVFGASKVKRQKRA